MVARKVPANVQELSSQLSAMGVWHSVTNNANNEAAYNCEDAAAKRTRLGYQGIPLCDELKSNLGFVSDPDGHRHYLLLHCRGNQRLDEKKISTELAADFHRLPADELMAIFHCEYGLVNPFGFASRYPWVTQIFDSGLNENLLPPYTLMTNASDLRWGIEFRVSDLIRGLSEARICDITTDISRPRIREHKIGILTGNSPESGIFLWRKINEAVKRTLGSHFSGDLSFPKVIVNSMPEMGISMELDIRADETLEIVNSGVTALCESGATLVAVACNTTQFFSGQIDRLCLQFGAEFFSMVDAVDAYLIDEQIEHFDLIGLRFVTDFGKWSDFKALNEKYQIELPSERDLDDINELAFLIKRETKTSQNFTKLRDVLNRATKTQTVIIALTELSILLEEQRASQKSDRRFVDTPTLLADRIAARYLEGIGDLLRSAPREKPHNVESVP